jgi:very-short-patch-repair endonuclease
VISRRQLVALGYSRQAIEHRLGSGRLHAVHRGVYAVGRDEVSQKGRWMGALLACGDEAFLSHRSAAALYRIGGERNEVIEVSIRRRGEHHRRGIRVRSRPSLPSHDVGTLERIGVTSPVRTLLDYATLEPPNKVERAINEADKEDAIDPDALRRALDRYAGEPGVRKLRKVLDKDTFRLSDQELELLFRPIAATAGIPVELTKVILNDFEVDFYWPSLGLVVETDGWRYHRTPSAQTRDALRFQLHTASGLTPVRFSHWQVKHEAGHVKDVLERTAARLRSLAPTPLPPSCP